MRRTGALQQSGLIKVLPHTTLVIDCYPQCAERQCECVYVKSRRGGARYPRSRPNAAHVRRSPSDHSSVSDVSREWECKFRRCCTLSAENKIWTDIVSAHLSSLSTPGSGLLQIDDSMSMGPMSSGCCSLPTLPTDIPKPTFGLPYTPVRQTSESSEASPNDPIRTYGSDRTL
jgi:hypothetical protein